MKTILVPTDFSVNARNALDFAAALAEKMQSRLVLFHAYWHPLYEEEEIDSPEDLLTRDKIMQQEKQMQEETITSLKELQKQLNNNYRIPQVDYALANGLPVDEILIQVETLQASLVVMGTKGASGVKEIVLGSNAADVMERCACPVLVIPQQAVWRGINHIVFATDYHNSDLQDIHFLSEVAVLFQAQLIIVHIEEGTFWASDKRTTAKLEALKAKVEESIAYKNILFDLVDGTDTLKALQSYAEIHRADILAMSTHKRNLWQKLFGKNSLTLQMAFHSHIPLLAFKSDVSNE